MAYWPIVSYRSRPPVISSGFGFRTQKGTRVHHHGADIDFRAVEGDPPYTGKYTANRTPRYFAPAGQKVVAFDDGVVVQSKDKPRIGGDVWVHHKQSGLVTRYAHLSARAVNVGDEVQAGDELGIWGAGHGTPFVHLHFEVLRAGEKESWMDPAQFLREAQVLAAPIRSRGPAAIARGRVRGPVTRVDVTRPQLGGFPWVLLLLFALASTRR